MRTRIVNVIDVMGASPAALQWGRACEDADRMMVSTLIWLASSLQWGRACEDADSTRSIVPRPPPTSLQWGRACEDADR